MKIIDLAHWRKVLGVTFAGWSQNNVLRLSAALAYYSVFSITPLLVVAVTLVSRVLGEKMVHEQLSDQLSSTMGSAAAVAAQSLIESHSSQGQGFWAAIFGFVVLLVGASGVFSQLKEALNEIWQVQPAATGLRGTLFRFLMDRLLTFGMVLVIGFLLLISLVASTALAAAGYYVAPVLPVPLWLIKTGGLGFAVCMETSLFMLIFRALPDTHVPWKHAVRGAIVTTLLFEIGKWALGLYLALGSTTSGFGASGSLVLILLWFYYTSLIFYTGAEFTRASQLTEASARQLAVTVSS